LPDKVLLRDVIVDDLPIFFAHQLDPDATRMAAFPSRARDPFNAHWAKILADAAINKKTITFDGQVAGNIVSWEQSGEREVGYWIGKDYWGKGIGTRALSEFLRLVRTRPLFAHVAQLNIGSFRVLEKNGFKVISQDAEEYILKLD
jgi:RimJ/RimL family protein N-acetyltransferase